ncbi:GNAT family N-acetyltransferase [Geitlerinema splendidum]|nr:GNAT family N-acetyltransferase [Geitlerinema splendidum]
MYLFFEKRGYKTTVALATAELDLHGKTFEFESWLNHLNQHQIQLRRWSEIGDSEENRLRLYEMFSDIDKDEPGVGVFGSFGRAEFERDTFDAGYWEPDWLWVATFGDEWIGMHQILRITESGSACGIGYTGVVKHHRGKGIGRAMKQVGIATAQKAGFTKIKTNNDKTNAPMLKINEQLGFQSANGWLFMGKDITG